MLVKADIARGGLMLRRRLRAEDGFTMLLAIGILFVTSLIAAAISVALIGNVHSTERDLDARRAFDAAQAASNIYLYQLNQNPNYWSTCANDYAGSASSPIAVPGSTASYESYSWQPVLANGSTTCTSDAVTSLVDSATGTLRMEFTGYSGNPTVSRTVVVSYRKHSPFDYVWYTVYEATDPALGPAYANCGQFLRTGNRPTACNIQWASSDHVNGPMYTQDQFLIGGSPTFGRSSADPIESLAGTGQNVCADISGSSILENNCGSANIVGNDNYGSPNISPPSTNSQLLADAQAYGKVYTGVTTIALNGNGSATVTNCPTSSCTTTTFPNMASVPLIYVQNGSPCPPPPYNGTVPSYQTTGCAGDVYVSGSYTSSLTIAAANNIIISGNLTTTENSGVPTGSAVLGLVANQFIRIEHGFSGPCNGSSVPVNGEYTPNLTIDAALLALQHSFILDNYACGAALGTLTIHGTIAQYFRGPVATTGSGGAIATGYAKNYWYDDRLSALLPPYLFDISTSGWAMSRQTLCTPGSSAAGGCSQ